MSLDKKLIDKLVNITSSASIACHKYIGKNDKLVADKSATDSMRNNLNKLDNYVENLFNTINTKRLAGEDWLIMVVSDHGGDETGHGDAQNPYINQTIFFAQHPSLVFKNQYTSSQADLAPTILDFLGISNPNFDCQTDGVSLFEE